jgi:signal transduction histidine kinase
MEPESPRVFRPSTSKNEEHLRLLIQTGLLLASERSLDVIVQAALDAGLHLSGARCGAFFFSTIGADTHPCHLYRVVGPGANALEAFALPNANPGIHPNLFEQGIVRSPDITQAALTPLYHRNRTSDPPPAASSANDSASAAKIRSYLAVPVRSRGGDVLGGLLYGHPQADVFAPASENLVATVASQLAVAIDNVRLAESLDRETSLAESSRTLQRQTSVRLRQALDAAQLGTWTWDTATDVLDLDERAAQLLHTQPHIPITRTELRDRIVASDDLLSTSEKLRQSVASGGHYHAEYRIDEPGGLQTWVSSNGIATHADGSSAVTGMVGTVQDITSRKLQESALRQSEKLAATGRLAATIAHEINNPLEAVTNLIYLSRTDPEVPAHVCDLLETADTELARVAQIAQQTLGFYCDTTRPVQIDLNELLRSVVDLFARKMRSSKIDSTIDLEPDLYVQGLKGEIRQVFSNLVVNAIDAFESLHRPSRRIHIRGRRIDGSNPGVCVSVCDAGAGIPPAVRERIFSPFFTTKQSVGTGLGLWVTRGFVQKHGGHIRFRSRTSDPTGTVFRVFLPARMQAIDTGQTTMANTT